MRVGLLLLLFVVSTVFAAGNDSEEKASDHREIKRGQMCGQYCLERVLRHLGKTVKQQDILMAIPPMDNGSTFEQLNVVAESYGIKTLGLRISKKLLFELQVPAILYVNENHFIAFIPDKERERFLIVDPPKGYLVHDLADIAQRWKWDGDCLLMNDGNIIVPMKSGYPLYRVFMVCALGVIAAVLSAAWFARKRGSRKMRIAIVMIVLINIMIGRSLASEGTGLPSIFVENPVYDAGLVFEDTKVVKHTFKIQNKGSANLIVSSVKANCSCITSLSDPNSLAPGQTSDLAVEINLKGAYGKLVEQKIAVVTNDPKKPVTVLSVQVERRREFELKPKIMNIGVVPQGEEKIAFMWVKGGTKTRKLLVEKARVAAPYIKVAKVVDSTKSGGIKHYLIKITLSSSAPPGILKERIHIPCLGASYGSLEIPVNAEIISAIKPSVSDIPYGIIRSQVEAVTKQVFLRSASPFTITSVHADQPWVSVTSDRIDKNNCELRVTILTSKAPKGNLKSNIFVQTDTIDRSIVIPLTAFSL